MQEHNPEVINLLQPDTPIGPDNRLLNVLMSEEQLEEMLSCVDQVQRSRERARNFYYNRKSKEEPKKRRNIFPPSPYQQYLQQQQQQQGTGGRIPLQLVINKS